MVLRFNAADFVPSERSKLPSWSLSGVEGSVYIDSSFPLSWSSPSGDKGERGSSRSAHFKCHG